MKYSINYFLSLNYKGSNMKTQVFKRILASTMAMALIFAMAGVELGAQTDNDFTNNSGGTYKTTEGFGRIIMRGQGGTQGMGVFRSDDGNELGRDATNRIQGTVEWSRATGTQTIQGDNAAGAGVVYYTNLELSGDAAKNIEDNVWVFGNYNPEYNGAAGNRTYTGIFHYDGDGTISNGVGTGAAEFYQIIYGESASSGAVNRYNNLDITQGTKINNDEVNCIGYITNSAADDAAELIVAHNFTIGTGASIITANMTIDPTENLGTAPGSAYFKTTSDGTMEYGHASTSTTLQVNATGLLDLMSTGEFTVMENGTLDLADDASNPGALNVGYNSGGNVVAILNFDGIFKNNSQTANTANRTNMTFAEESTVRYREASGTPEVAGTNPSEYPAASGENNYKYGNLELSGAVDKLVDGSVYMRGDLSVSDANFIISTDNTLADNTLLDMDVTNSPSVTYDVSVNAGRYVQGKMRISGTIPTGTALKMNNDLTQVTFDPTAGAPDEWFQLDVFPGLSSQGASASADYQQIKALKPAVPSDWLNDNLERQVRMNFSNTGGGTPKISRLQVAFDPTNDIKTGPWDAEKLAKIRFFEGYDAAEEQQKLLMRGHPATTNADNVILSDSLIELTDLGDGGSPYQLDNGSDVILGAPPVLYITVQDGRWSNPVTWDEGVVPPYFADAEVRHLVYTGCDGVTFGMQYNTNDERDGQGAIPSPDINAAAKSITIVRKDPSKGWDHPCLVIGNEPGSLNSGHIFRTQMSAPAPGEKYGIYNLNDGGATPPAEYGPNLVRSETDPAQLAKLQGIYVMRPDGGSNPIVGAGLIFNQGWIYNEGTVFVGQ